MVNIDKETLQCDQCELNSISGHELSEHKKVKNSVELFMCDQCDSVSDNQKVLKCHQEKKHNLTFSPIPQVDGHLEKTGVDMVIKQKLKEPVKEELHPNPKNQSGYSCSNFKFKCEGHKTLSKHIQSTWEAQAHTKKTSKQHPTPW